VVIAEGWLVDLKAGLFDPTMPEPELGEIQRIESFLRVLRSLDGIELVRKYRTWAQKHQCYADGMVHAAKSAFEKSSS
jgi:hypothetical protein